MTFPSTHIYIIYIHALIWMRMFVNVRVSSIAWMLRISGKVEYPRISRQKIRAPIWVRILQNVHSTTIGTTVTNIRLGWISSNIPPKTFVRRYECECSWTFIPLQSARLFKLRISDMYEYPRISRPKHSCVDMSANVPERSFLNNRHDCYEYPTCTNIHEYPAWIFPAYSLNLNIPGIFSQATRALDRAPVIGRKWVENAQKIQKSYEFCVKTGVETRGKKFR